MDDATTETYNANVHRGVYTIAEEATAALRGGPGQGRRASSTRRRPREIVFTKNATEAINLVAYSWGRANLQRRRRGRAHRDGAPRQHRAVAHARRRARHRAALDPARPPTTASTSPTSTALLDGAKLLGVTAMSNVLGTHQRRSASSPTPPTPPARSCSSTPASTCPTSPPTSQAWDADFVALHRPQDARADRHRRAVGAATSCSRRCRRSSAAAR